MSEDTQVEEGEVIGEYSDDVMLSHPDSEGLEDSFKRPSSQSESSEPPLKKQEVSKYIIERNVGKGSYG